MTPTLDRILAALNRAVKNAANADQTDYTLTPGPVCAAPEGCHRVVPCDPGCGARKPVRPAAQQPVRDDEGQPICTCTYRERCPGCLADAIERVRQLHTRVEPESGSPAYCAHCVQCEDRAPWPCDTIRALDGIPDAKEAEPEPLTTGTDDDYCGIDPPQRADDPDSQWGDCWCTRPSDHEGEHRCEPCTSRHGAPGWDENGAVRA
ncbi:hypothetical protein ABZ883_14755 [Streptomyces sp. NPDC046977]|uniref:hypothetical protein n=1 Tax=Streptomyces sp. NPDC046977 TaxID=3154703 RepID=UPI0033D8F5EF